MNFKADFEFYSIQGQEVVYDTIVDRVGGDIVKLEKKLSYYSQIDVSTLLATKTLDFINGSSNPRLYEFKIKNLPTPVRFVCSFEGKTLLFLDVFFSSGSKGSVEKHLKVASSRLHEWRQRQTN